MEFFKPGSSSTSWAIAEVLDRRLSSLFVVVSLFSFFYPGPNYGTDFKGGTEIEVAFTRPRSTAGGDARRPSRRIGFSDARRRPGRRRDATPTAS